MNAPASDIPYEYIQWFVQAAKNAVDGAVFDGVECSGYVAAHIALSFPSASFAALEFKYRMRMGDASITHRPSASLHTSMKWYHGCAWQRLHMVNSAALTYILREEIRMTTHAVSLIKPSVAMCIVGEKGWAFISVASIMNWVERWMALQSW
ncbi:hypothetical protein BDN70DRAFT_924345 [Pholiota conissans]|uniref:Uncharacterized protein n=1 Tax=Pholiota conissans TaxID=109636 RepID=A0A9P5YTL1_9AGAR|nr:hypothetical protein BDN70DRAFT_924345 [Pholiota conissans]